VIYITVPRLVWDKQGNLCQHGRALQHSNKTTGATTEFGSWKKFLELQRWCQQQILYRAKAGVEFYSFGTSEVFGVWQLIRLQAIFGSWIRFFGWWWVNKITASKTIAGNDYYRLEYSGEKLVLVLRCSLVWNVIYYWDPVISPSGITFYSVNYTEWITIYYLWQLMPSQHVIKTCSKDNEVVAEERLLTKLQ